MAYCPHCSFSKEPLGSYLQPWDFVKCPQCSHTFPAGSWLMEDGSPFGEPFEEHEDYEISRVVEVENQRTDRASYHLTPGETPEEARPVAFISHNKADKDFARQIGVFLCRNGTEVWFDQWDMFAGDPIIDSIEEGLDRCDIFVLVISPRLASVKLGSRGDPRRSDEKDPAGHDSGHPSAQGKSRPPATFH